MAFETIDTAEIQVKKAVTRSLFQKIKDSLDFLNGIIGTIELQGLQNGSFEIDSDADGIPDNWFAAPSPGGLLLIDGTSPAHGARAFKFVHPGGAGNGGGVLSSDYIPVSSSHLYVLDFIHWLSGSLRNLVEIDFYTKAKVYISSATLYDQTAAFLASPVKFAASFTPPANACFCVVFITGGHTSSTAAGTAWFDGIRLNPPVWNIGYSVPFTIAEGTTSSTSWVDVNGAAFVSPLLNSPVTLVFTADVQGDCTVRYRIGSNYSNEIIHTGAYQTYTFTISAPIGVSGVINIAQQIKAASGLSGTARKPSAAATLRFNL